MADDPKKKPEITYIGLMKDLEKIIFPETKPWQKDALDFISAPGRPMTSAEAMRSGRAQKMIDPPWFIGADLAKPEAKPKTDNDLQNRINDLEHALQMANNRHSDEIEALKKQIAKLPTSYEPRSLTSRSKIDYTEVISEDEDLLEADYRGWPLKPEDKIF